MECEIKERLQQGVSKEIKPENIASVRSNPTAYLI